MKPFAVTIGLALSVGGALIGLSGKPLAQPAVSFTSSCEDLRANLQKLGATGDELVTIEIVGALTLVKSGSGLAYLGMCEAPAPRVLCVTYDAEDLKPGDKVSISGSLAPRGPDHVLLDPCLYHREGTPP